MDACVEAHVNDVRWHQGRDWLVLAFDVGAPVDRRVLDSAKISVPTGKNEGDPTHWVIYHHRKIPILEQK